MPLYVDPTEQLVTEIFVRDIKHSTKFYCQLGFELLRDDGDFVVLAWDGHHLFLDEHIDRPSHSDFPQANIRVMVPDVDKYWKLAGEIGAPVLNSIADRTYGLRDFTVADPDGFGVRFGTRHSDNTGLMNS